MALIGMILSVPVYAGGAQIPPAPDQPMHAQTPLGFVLRSRCPDMRIVADEDSSAVVIFWLTRNGNPSQISVKTSSGSDALDAAALSCVSKMRFPPATALGDAQPIDSWQQIAMSWAKGHGGDTSAAQNPGADSSRVAGADEAAPPGMAAGTRRDGLRQATSVTVRVCVDDAGQLKQEPTVVHSSGRASLDQAAVKIAASGAAYYRPELPSSESALSGCAQLAIQFDK